MPIRLKSGFVCFSEAFMTAFSGPKLSLDVVVRHPVLAIERVTEVEARKGSLIKHATQYLLKL